MGGMKRAAILLLPIVLTAGCATAAQKPRAAGMVVARLGETVRVNGSKVTPLAVLEDSRCPESVTCIWAGQVRISARIDFGGNGDMRELTLGKPVKAAGGSLELAEVRPPRMTKAAIPTGDYRFAFRFGGGL
jgi:hypothetical protein